MKNFNPKILQNINIANKDGSTFSFFDYLHNLSEGPEKALVYSKLFWPDLVQIDDFILLSEHYDRKYFDQVLSDYGPTAVETTINTSYLYDFVKGKCEYSDEVWEALGLLLCETWKMKASFLYPDRAFTTEFSWYSEKDDPGITLFQTNRDKGCEE